MKPGDDEYERLKRSIETFGYVDPIIVNADGTVIGGHQRLFVLRDLGFSEADVAVVDLNKNDEKALNIALNKISGEWDEEKLAAIFADLQVDGYDITLSGFSQEEQANLTDALVQGIEEAEDGDVEREDLSDKVSAVYEVIIECDDEEHQRMVFESLTEEGYECRVLTL